MAIDKYVAAIPLWQAAGDLRREALTLRRVAVLYGYLGDSELEIRYCELEAEAWERAGEPGSQANRLQFVGSRFESQGDLTRALEYYERSIAIARSFRIHSTLRLSLNWAAAIYRSSGDVSTADRYEAESATALGELNSLREGRKPKKIDSTVPDGWIDVASCPLVAEVKEIDGRKQAVLTNRSAKSIVGFVVGCSVVEAGRVRVVGTLFPFTIYDSAIVSGGFLESPFESLAEPLNDWTDERPKCTPGSRILVTAITFKDGTTWKAVDQQ